ncbi:MAG: PilZ domain-containing protein [Bryobacteraceae bacterium]
MSKASAQQSEGPRSEDPQTHVEADLLLHRQDTHLLSDAERRREDRWDVATPCTIRARMLPDTELIGAKLQNVSKRGAAILAGNFIPPGAYVAFHLAEENIIAQVRHCRSVAGGFLIGLAFSVVVDRQCHTCDTLDAVAGTQL